jgi:hypothetical protein
MKDQLDHHERELKEFRQQLKDLEVSFLPNSTTSTPI